VSAVRGGTDADALLSALFRMSLSRRHRTSVLLDAVTVNAWKPANALFKHVKPVFLLDPSGNGTLLGLVAGMR